MISKGDQKIGVATTIKHNHSTPIFLCCNESYNIEDMPSDENENSQFVLFNETYDIQFQSE